MPEVSFTTVQILAAGKFLLAAVFVLGIFSQMRRGRPLPWLFVAALTVGASLVFTVFMLRGAALWNRLTGDELLTTAFYQRVISDGFGHDFSYWPLAPFYPPLWFYVIGSIAAAWGLTGVGAAKLGALAALTVVVPLVWVWRAVALRRHDDPVVRQPLFAVLVAVLPLAAVELPEILTKPYEFITAILALLWYHWVQSWIGSARSRRLLGYMIGAGVVGALIASAYYLWLLLVAIAAALQIPWSRWSSVRQYLARWLAIAGLTLLGSAWYWGPWIAGLVSASWENWISGFFVPTDLNIFPPIALTLRSFWLWLGVFGLVVFRQRPIMRQTGMVVLATYLWQAVSLLTILVAHVPFQASRGFSFLGEVALSFAAAYAVTAWVGETKTAGGFSHVREVIQSRWFGAADATAVARIKWFSLWVVISLSLPFGRWLDQPSVRERLTEIRQPDATLVALRDAFSQHPEAASLTTLSFYPKLSAVVPLRLYVNWNQHYSHPAANFSRRFYYLQGLASAQTPAEFARRFREENPFEPIQQLILYPNGDNYELYFWLDNYPNGGREAVVRWPKRLIAEPHFQPIPELSLAGFAAWRPVAGIR